MAHKGKQILWHKKSGKILPSKFLKIHGKKTKVGDSIPESGDKLRDFAIKLKAQIKKAANKPL